MTEMRLDLGPTLGVTYTSKTIENGIKELFQACDVIGIYNLMMIK
jgi:hypothetical protein